MRQINETEFDSITASGTTLVDFGAEWCAPCKAILPLLQRMSTEYEGRMNIVSVDIDNSPDLAARHGVMSVPTLLLFRDGQPVERIVGAVSEKELKRRVEPHFA